MTTTPKAPQKKAAKQKNPYKPRWHLVFPGNLPITVCVNEVQYNAVNTEATYPWMAQAFYGQVAYQMNKEKNNKQVIVSINPNQDLRGLLNTAVHEAVHVVERVFEHMGEDKPGEETQAYLTEEVFDIIMDELAENKCLSK